MPGGAEDLRNFAQGFRVDGTLVLWGIGLAEAARLFGAAPRDGRPVAQFLCRDVAGIAVLSGELTAPQVDRPVLGASFEIAPVPQALWRPNHWYDMLKAALGEPAAASRSDVPPHADASGCVTFYARWNGDDCSIGLSIYGAPRTVLGGRSIGTLWLGWSEAKAAEPFIAEWRERCAWLDGCAARLSKLDRFSVDEKLYPMSSGGYHPVGLSAEIAARRASGLVLHYPDILLTPRAIASKLTTRSFAIWTSEADGIWCASTAWDSIAYPIGTPVTANWAEILAAKGPGYSELGIRPWGVRSGDRSREIAAAAQRLRGIPGVTVKHHEGYNA
ncbi:hypothetical protein [Desertibaculum subflavum]|uniref:hypothetical protein n=1 Tax=Desertibaculum subflavum TaxID=2268458 RepID=UPI000E66F6FE